MQGDIYNPNTGETIYQAKYSSIPDGFQAASAQSSPSILTNQASISSSTLSGSNQPMVTPPARTPAAGAALNGAISGATAGNGRQTGETPEQYLQRTDPTSLANFKAANPGLSFEEQDLSMYLNPNSQTGSSQAGSNTGSQTGNNITNEKATVETQKQSLFDRLFGSPSKTSLQDTAYSTVNDIGSSVNSARKELNDINNQLLSEQTSSRHAIEALQKAGGTAGGIDLQADQIKKDSLSRQADLSVILQAKQNNYELAKSIADRKVDAQLETEKNKIDAYKFMYQENKDQFTKDEQRQYEENIKKQDREFDQKKADLKTISDISLEALKGGAPANVAAQMRQAKTPEEAISIGGQYVGSLDRQKQVLEIAKLNREIATMGVPSISNPAATPYAGALSTILGSGTFTKDQKASIANAINSGNDPFSVIKNQAKNIMGQTLATDLTKFETAKAQVQGISSLLSQYYANGGETGIFTGNYETTLNKLGTLNDPKLVGIAINIMSALQIYRNAVSGTAYSVQEGKDIASIFPGINKSEGLNKAIIEGRLNAFDTTIDAAYRTTLGKDYDTLKKLNVDKSVAEKEAKDKVVTLGQGNPQLQTQIKSFLTQDDPTLGRPLTYEEVLQVVSNFGKY